MDVTSFLQARLEESNFEVVVKPKINIVAFRSANNKRLVIDLRQRGWYVSYVPRLDCVRVVVMPHSTKRHITDFMRVLRELA
jgi:glutamate/tyrosine decarboxylase-like PLP-dependent enzyme